MAEVPTMHDGLTEQDALALAERDDLAEMMRLAAARRDQRFGDTVTFSRKVFIPLTMLCRDVCHYCTFATTPSAVQRAYMTIEEVVASARSGAASGCDEALFTLGEKPELRFHQARRELEQMGYSSTLEYLRAAAEAVLKETGLLPHINAGTMTEADVRMLKEVSASQGLMLESSSDRLMERGGPHFGSPDKVPARRLETIEAAGRAKVPFTTGILIGIGETRAERIDALLRIQSLHSTYGHIQEVIIQNFRAKPGTRMKNAPEPTLEEHQWTIAAARLILASDISIQAPPNLRMRDMHALIAAGVNDWGGVSPVTPDFVNPEYQWPTLEALADETALAGKTLAPRLTVYPRYIAPSGGWISTAVRPSVLARADGAGLAHEASWRVGTDAPSGELRRLLIKRPGGPSASTRRIVDGIAGGERPSAPDLATLFDARGPDAEYIRRTADELRSDRVGDVVSYVINRNINYTNVCGFRCGFCAFSKGKTSLNLRGTPYDLSLEEISRRVVEAWEHGATEVCLQGGIHPDYSGETYSAIVKAVRKAVPAMHIHAFSALEIQQGAETLGVPVPDFLTRLRAEGLDTLPGTAAEILDDEVRRDLCPDKLNTEEWLDIHASAHRLGLRSTATMMFGHIDGYIHWARHMLRIRDLQEETGGFTEFVPLPFVHMEAPIYRSGRSRQGPSLRETLLVHAVARLVFNTTLPNIQASWVKLGREIVTEILRWGVNDIGGTLMNESISRAAGNKHGQALSVEDIQQIGQFATRPIRQRDTLYRTIAARPVSHTVSQATLSEPQEQRAGKYARAGSLSELRRLTG